MVANDSACGVRESDGPDCEVPVEPGSPFNVCPLHYRAIRDHLTVNATAVDQLHRLDTPCPVCGVRALQGSVLRQIATCAACGHEMSAEEARTLNGFASGFRGLPRPQTVPPSSVVYYLRFGDRIKIGTTTDLAKRLIALPHDELLLTEPGSYELEKQRHRQFNRHLIAGREWFEAHPDLLNFIAERRAALAAA